MSVRDVTKGVAGDVTLDSTGIIYLGDPNTDGSWRIVRSSDDLVIQRRESSVWVEKSAFMP